ncbi:NAD(P)/FAD-dependent oxidoreductase [Arcticibacterium luteifluviistationis]|uniref:Amino acid dehydrogenase n=1 Tax=Arcticibacterium luteifluviistationis TaxID=1784714 RepID=A0A2Z4GD38_9BACT|nr:FAD-dependent oxidoreductase [Arcticibacterium luteifluviistationis]AWV99061.1 amino acid dehydrogenase [Arcticibacterium luteifluviistationis]
MKVHIIGSGIIGLFSAYYLVKEGHEVEIIEQYDGEDGCSFQNAGMITPSHFIPLAAPGMVQKALKWMLDDASPFYVKPRFDLSMLNWSWKFMQSASQKKVDAAMPVLRDFLVESRALYLDLVSSNELAFDFEKKGLLLLCKTEHVLEGEAQVAAKAHDLGIKAEVLTRDGVHKLEPEALPDVLGGVFYPDDSHCNPQKLVGNLKSFLLKKGVKFLYNTKVVDAAINGNKVEKLQLQLQNNELKEIKVEKVVVAAGSWSEGLAKLFKLNIPMQAGKGYSFLQQQEASKKILHPTILCEAKVAVTPFMDNQVRFAGTMELAGINPNINKKRVRAIAQAGENFYGQVKVGMPKDADIWYGLRPCSPDGLPYVGKAKQLENVVVASGHAMLGISLAPITGQVVSKLILEKNVSQNIGLFDIHRFEK